MPNSLKARLKKCVHKGILTEKDLDRIVVLTEEKACLAEVKQLEDLREHCSGMINNTCIGGADIWRKDVEALDSAIKALEQQQQSCGDAISRSQALKELEESAKRHANDSREEVLLRRDRDIIRALPTVTPQHTEAEIQKMQELEQAEIQKAYELGKAEENGRQKMNALLEYILIALACPLILPFVEPQESEDDEE